jgi:hypothetical protein
MHLDEERIQRLLHGQLARAEEGHARGHVAECETCRQSLADAEQEEHEIHSLLGSLDAPVAAIDVEAIVARAREPIAIPRGPRAPDPRLRWAAGIALAIALGGAAYALPGSPLRAWLAALGERAGSRSQPAPRVTEPTDESHVAGVAVEPGDRLLILFASNQAAGRAEVSLTDDEEVVVRAAAGSATFTSEVGQLLIDNAGSTSSYEIRIPRTAPHVEVRVGGRRLFLKEGSRVMTGPPIAGDRYLLPLSP